MMEKTGILIVIPAFNEEKSITGVIASLREHVPGADYLIVNDGSTDRTLETARQTGAAVVNLVKNIGIGGTVQTGFKYALKYGYDIMIQFDGDHQHPADQIGLLVDTMRARECDLVIGSRFLKPEGFKTTFFRMPGVIFLARAVSLLTGLRVTDTTSGFRAYGRRAIALFADQYPQRYPEPEALVLACKNRLTVYEIPVTMQERRTGASSINLLTGLHYMFTVTLNLFIANYKKTGE